MVPADAQVRSRYGVGELPVPGFARSLPNYPEPVVGLQNWKDWPWRDCPKEPEMPFLRSEAGIRPEIEMPFPRSGVSIRPEFEMPFPRKAWKPASAPVNPEILFQPETAQRRSAADLPGGEPKPVGVDKGGPESLAPPRIQAARPGPVPQSRYHKPRNQGPDPVDFLGRRLVRAGRERFPEIRKHGGTPSQGLWEPVGRFFSQTNPGFSLFCPPIPVMRRKASPDAAATAMVLPDDRDRLWGASPCFRGGTGRAQKTRRTGAPNPPAPKHPLNKT